MERQQPNTCSICDRGFKLKHHLLRHERTVHGETALKCMFCPQTFSRTDNPKRHLKGHKENIPSSAQSECAGRKRSPESQMDTSNVEKRRKVDNAGICIWCTQQKQLLPGKRFCAECGENGQECRWCHRLLPEMFHSRRTDVCDTCITRRENHRGTRWNCKN